MLEIKHLAAYYPYKLQMTRNGFIGELKAMADSREFKVSCSDWWESLDDTNHYKPILRPLSDLTKEIEVNGEKFVPIQKLGELFEMSVIEYCFIEQNPELILGGARYVVVNKLLEWHFDVFGLIPQGSAIDINTL